MLNRRSMTAEIVDRLDKSFSAWPSIQLPRELYDRAIQNSSISLLEQVEEEMNLAVYEIAEKRLPKKRQNPEVGLGVDFEILIDELPDEVQDQLYEKFHAVLDEAAELVKAARLNEAREEHADFKKETERLKLKALSSKKKQKNTP